MLKIGIIVGSTRPGRKADAVAKWVYELARTRSDAEFQIVDVADFNLPLLDEAIPPLMAKYQNAHTLAWSAKIAEFDGYVFVTPEYNHGTSGALKNAIDFLWRSGTTKLRGLSAMAAPAGPERRNNCAW
jgi:NAD(P)H-dependent FMN reductase